MMRHLAIQAWNVWCVVAALGATVIVFVPQAIPGWRREVVYVGPKGSDWSWRADSDAPLRTIATALRRVACGGRIVLLPGEYEERIHIYWGGTEERPLCIEAERAGTARLTWKAPLPVRSSWRPEGGGIFSAEIGWPVYVVRYGDQHLFRVPWGGVEALRRIAKREGACHSFVVVGRRIYVYLRGGVCPDRRLFATHRAVPPPREWGVFKSANVWIEANHVRIRGIQFDFGIGASALLWNAKDVVFEDCLFTGATHGVRSAGPCLPERITIRRCLYHFYPLHSWSIWLGWHDLYAAYSAHGLAKLSGDGHTIEACVVVHAADGLQVTVPKEAYRDGVRIAGNWIGQIGDDGVELDGDACGVVVEGNLFWRCHTVFGTSPVARGPCLIRGNVAYQEPSANVCHVKLLSPWKDEDGKPVPIRRLTITGNVLAGGWAAWWSPEVAVHESTIRGNWWVGCRRNDPPWPDSVEAERNRWWDGARVATGPNALERKVADLLRRPGCPVSLMELSHRAGPRWYDLSGTHLTREIVSFEERLLARVGRP